MYTTLFYIAMVATLAWPPLIFLPTWRWTRRLAETPAVPLFLSALYGIGLAALGVTYGPAIALNVFTAEGVQSLLANGDIGLVCWIHFLAFDLLVGLWIYRDNMAHRYVPLWAQSVLLFFTVMFGPLGFLAYSVIRWFRSRRPPGGAESSSDPAAEEPAKEPPAGLPTYRALMGLLAVRLREDPLLFCGSSVGLVLALAAVVVMLVRGPSFPPSGDLTKVISFDLAAAIYSLSFWLLLPVAGFSPRGRRRWAHTFFGVGVTGYVLANVQAYRGGSVRFSLSAAPVDLAAFVGFSLVGLGLFALFLVFAWRVLKRSLSGPDGLLALGVRYACGSTLLAYAVGFCMQALGGARVGATGNLLPLHAVGFHGLQAVPLVALLLRWSVVPQDAARRWVHAAGLTWFALAAAVAWQTVLGRSVLEVSPVTLLAGALFVSWAALAGLAALAWYRSGLRLPRLATV